MMAALAAFVLSVHAQQVMDLDKIFELADRQSTLISLSQIGLKAAGEAVEEAKSARLPSVNLQLSGSYIGDATLMSRGFSTGGTTDVILAGIGPQSVPNGRQDTPHWGNAFSVQASQVIYAGGAVKAGIRMAELDERMASLNVEKNRQDVRFMLTGYYLDLCKLHNQLKVVNQNIGLAEKLLSNMRARLEQGTVLKNDITRYELQIKSLELSKVKILDAAAVINHQVVTLLHLPEGTVVEPDTVALAGELLKLQGMASQREWCDRAADNNVGIRQATVASEMAEQKVKVAKAAAMPSVAMVVEDHLFGPFTNDLIPVNANVNTWFVGVGITYNLSSLWKNKHRVSRSMLDAERSRESLSLEREGVQNASQAHYVGFLTSLTEVQTQEKQVELASQNYEVVSNRYRNDLALITDMLDASNMKLSEEMALVNARIALLYNYYKLRYITSSL